MVKGADDAHKAEIENFHGVLMDISLGKATRRVREFLVQAYVRGAMSDAKAEKCDLERNTAVFTKRQQT